jgi:hypothetical protein
VQKSAFLKKEAVGSLTSGGVRRFSSHILNSASRRNSSDSRRPGQILYGLFTLTSGSLKATFSHRTRVFPRNTDRGWNHAVDRSKHNFREGPGSKHGPITGYIYKGC